MVPAWQGGFDSGGEWGAQITGTDAFDVVSARIQGDAWVDRLRWTDIVWDGKPAAAQRVGGRPLDHGGLRIQLTDARITGATWLKVQNSTQVVNYLNGSVADSPLDRFWPHLCVQTAGSSLGYRQLLQPLGHAGQRRCVAGPECPCGGVGHRQPAPGRLELMDGSLTLYGAQFVGGQVHGWGSAGWLNLLNGSRLADVGFSGWCTSMTTPWCRVRCRSAIAVAEAQGQRGLPRRGSIWLAIRCCQAWGPPSSMAGFWVRRGPRRCGLRMGIGFIGNRSARTSAGAVWRVVNEGDIEITSGSKCSPRTACWRSLFGTVHFDGDTNLTLGSASAAVGGDWRVFVGAAGLRGQGNQSRYSLMVLSGNLLDVPGWGFNRLDNALQQLCAHRSPSRGWLQRRDLWWLPETSDP